MTYSFHKPVDGDWKPAVTPTFTPTGSPLPGLRQANEDDVGEPSTITASTLEVFQGYLYARTRNHETGCETWRYDGFDRAQVISLQALEVEEIGP